MELTLVQILLELVHLLHLQQAVKHLLAVQLMKVIALY
jgi:hypothetical protein